MSHVDVVMLTGATGYLGQAVLRELLGAGLSVRALVRDPARLADTARPGLTVCRGDLLDLSSLEEAARGVDAIVHVAGLVTDWVPDVADFRQVNVTGVANVIAAARSCGVARILATSSVMVFGPSDGLVAASESTHRPARAFFLPYQRSKAQGLELLRAARSPDLHVAITFPGALFGAGPLTGGNYLACVLQALQAGAFPALPRTRGCQWCLAHVDDVARGHLLALQVGDVDGEWILGGDNVTFDGMLEIMAQGLGLSRLPARVPGRLMLAGVVGLCAWYGLLGQAPPITLGAARGLLHDWAFSSARATRQLGYGQRPFQEAFPAFVRWYVETEGSCAPSKGLSDSP